MYNNVNWILSKKQRKASRKPSETYQNLSEEEEQKNMLVSNIEIFMKKKKHQYSGERYRNIPKDEKQRLVEKRIKIFLKKKNKKISL